MKRVMIVLLTLAYAAPVAAQAPDPTWTAPPSSERGWLDVNVGTASAAQSALGVTSSFRLYQADQFFGTGNSVAIATYTTQKLEETAWGFHGGADASVMFSRVVGVGAFLRLSRGSVELEGRTGEAFDVKFGGFQSGGGLRLRF
jgi:hypothetical protein